MPWIIFIFLMELMVDHVSRRIQFGLIMLVFGASLLVWLMLSSICSNCDPVRVLADDDGKFPTECLCPGSDSM